MVSATASAVPYLPTGVFLLPPLEARRAIYLVEEKKAIERQRWRQEATEERNLSGQGQCQRAKLNQLRSAQPPVRDMHLSFFPPLCCVLLSRSCL